MTERKKERISREGRKEGRTETHEEIHEKQDIEAYNNMVFLKEPKIAPRQG